MPCRDDRDNPSFDLANKNNEIARLSERCKDLTKLLCSSVQSFQEYLESLKQGEVYHACDTIEMLMYGDVMAWWDDHKIQDLENLTNDFAAKIKVISITDRNKIDAILSEYE